MEKYSEQSRCPKCGYIGIGGVRTKYIGGTEQFDNDGNKLPDIPPFLARECPRCEYRWKEAPLDAEPKG